MIVRGYSVNSSKVKKYFSGSAYTRRHLCLGHNSSPKIIHSIRCHVVPYFCFCSNMHLGQNLLLFICLFCHEVQIPVLNRSTLDETLLDAGDRLEELGDRRTYDQLRLLAERQSSCVRPFVENIETVERFYNNPISLAFDNNTLYLGTVEVA